VVEKQNGECDNKGLDKINVESRLKPKYCGRIYVRVKAEVGVFMNEN
jgi:hypothetical protein